MVTLKAGGADVALCASNPLSTQDDVAAHLVRDHGITVFAIKGEDNDTYYEHIRAAIAHGPDITMDDGADVVGALHMIALGRLDDLAAAGAPVGRRRWTPRRAQALIDGVIGSTEETTTGVIRLKAMAKDRVLRFPVIAVNDSDTKHLFDNRYGTGQSTIDGIIRATNLLLAGSTFVVAGYGWCGRGVAMRARGLGANVIVTEIDPVKALEAVMDGYRVMTMADAAPIGDIFCTLTGEHRACCAVEHFRAMKDGAIVSQLGALQRRDRPRRARRSSRAARSAACARSSRSTCSTASACSVLGEGRLINLAAAEGHPASVMDMSFANQALGAEYLVQASQVALGRRAPRAGRARSRDRAPQAAGHGVAVDVLTAEQRKYLASWDLGT